MTARPRILLLIPHLGGGGAEQVAATLARNLSREKYELHLGLVTQSSLGDEIQAPEIHVHCIGASRVRSGAPGIVRLIWKLRPALVLSGMSHLNLLVLILRPLFPPKTRILIRQNCTLSPVLAAKELPSWTRLFFRVLYRWANRVICQSQSMAEDLCAETHLSRRKIAVLANPVDVEEIRAATARSQNLCIGTGPHILAVGRLSREKGFDLLLEAFASILERYPTAKLAIAGEGPEETALQAQRHALHLEESVQFLGRISSPASYFPGASSFVLPSRREGLPNALLEAAAAGLPIVALPASGGLVDLLHAQPGVWLASEVSLYALRTSMMEALAALELNERFPHPWIDHFRLARSISAYEELIDETIRRRRP